MTDNFAGGRSHALVMKGGALAAATVLSGAGLLGVAVARPEVAGASFVQVHPDVALTDFPTFAESLQNLLDAMGVGDLNDMLGKLSDSLGVTTPLTVGSDVSALLAALNPDHITLGGNADSSLFGNLLSEQLYSTSTTVDSLLGTGSLFQVGGVPIGNVDLNDLLDAVLGPGGGSYSLTAAANAVGLGPILSQYASLINGGNWLLGGGGLENYNVYNCSFVLGCDHPALTTNSSLSDWLSGLLGVNTKDATYYTYNLIGQSTAHTDAATTLGGYLHTVPITQGSSTMMDQATLGQLFGLNPSQTWDQYLSSLPIGGNVFDHTGTLGDQTLATFIDSFLPEGSTLSITGDTSITDILEAFGLLNW